MIPDDVVEMLNKSNPRAVLLDRERYDSALIGIGHRDTRAVAVYSVSLLILAICLWERVGEQDAQDWIEFDILPITRDIHGPILLGLERIRS